MRQDSLILALFRDTYLDEVAVGSSWEVRAWTGGCAWTVYRVHDRNGSERSWRPARLL